MATSAGPIAAAAEPAVGPDREPPPTTAEVSALERALRILGGRGDLAIVATLAGLASDRAAVVAETLADAGLARTVRTLELVDPAAGMPGERPVGSPAPPDRLTAAEHRVAVLAAGGLTNRQIGAHLVVEQRTVETHLTRIYRKTGRRREELAGVVAPLRR